MSDSVVTSKVLDKSLDKFAIKIINHIDLQTTVLRNDIAKIYPKYEHLLGTLDAFLKRFNNIEADNATRDVQLARLE
jgi:hypothetical protein